MKIQRATYQNQSWKPYLIRRERVFIKHSNGLLLDRIKDTTHPELLKIYKNEQAQRN